MAKNGIMVITGNSIKELEADLQAMKVAMATGVQGAVGDSSVEDVEKGLKALKTLVGGDVSPKVIEHSCPCCCESGCACCEDDIYDNDTYEEGYSKGYDEGKDAGYDEGYSEGRDACYEELVDDMGLLVELIEKVGVKKVLAALIDD